MHSTNALWRNNDESDNKAKANKSWKWKHILKPIWDEKDLYTGNGLTPSIPSIILPCEPIALVERLDILMASKASGNTRCKEQIGISLRWFAKTELHKQKYKIIMLQLEKCWLQKDLIKRNTLLEVLVPSTSSGKIARMFSSNAAKQLSPTTLQAVKTAAKDNGMKAIDVGETVAIDAGKKLVEKAAKKLTTPKNTNS